MIGYVDDLATFKLFGTIFPNHYSYVTHKGGERENKRMNAQWLINLETKSALYLK